MKDGMRRAFLLICSALALFIGARASDAAACASASSGSCRQSAAMWGSQRATCASKACVTSLGDSVRLV